MTDVVEIVAPPAVLTEIVGPDRGTVDVIGHEAMLVLVPEPVIELLEIVTAGPQGPPGPPGPMGPYGQRTEIEQTFAIPAFVWTVHHLLGGHPDVDTFDQNGDAVIGDVTYPDESTVVVTFAVELAGKVRLIA